MKGEPLKLFRNSQNLTNTHTDCEHGMLNNKIVVNSSIDHVLVTYQWKTNKILSDFKQLQLTERRANGSYRSINYGRFLLYFWINHISYLCRWLLVLLAWFKNCWTIALSRKLRVNRRTISLLGYRSASSQSM